MTHLSSRGLSSQGKPARSELGYGDYLRFRDLVLQQSGLYFPERKKADLEAGLYKALAESSAAASQGYNLDAYYKLLSDTNDPAGRAEMSRLINTLTIGETHFFRDEAQFNALADRVLPAMIARKRAAAAAVGPDIQPQLRFWSAGCASGEESYSLAILLRELLPDIDNWHILILATDVNQESLNRAREAHYSDWSFRENRAKALRPRYFNEIEGTDSSGQGGSSTPSRTRRYRLRDDIRRMVTFASLNLITDPYPSIHNNTVSMDLIMCRNVTIYFAEETTRQVVKRFYDSLVEGGWLVVGHAEPSLAIYRAFQLRNFPDALLYQKTGQPADWPADWEWLEGKSSQPALKEADWGAGAAPNGAGKSPTFPAQSNPSPSRPAAPAPRPSPRPPVSRPQAGRDPYELATALLERGRVEEAIKALEQKLDAKPRFAPAHALLGRAYANLGRWTESQRWCQSALKLDSLLAEPYYVLALVYQHEDQPEAAISMLKKAIYLDRDMALAHFNLATLHKKMGQAANARRSFQNSIRALEKLPPGEVVPDSGGATVQQLLDVARRLLRELAG